MLENYAMDLYKILAPVVGRPWDRIVLHGDVFPSSFQFDFYFRREPGQQFIKCYDVASFENLLPLYMDLAKLCRKAQMETRQEIEVNKIDLEVWTGFTYVLSADGNFTIDYEYGSMNAGLSEEWHEHYLQ